MMTATEIIQKMCTQGALMHVQCVALPQDEQLMEEVPERMILEHCAEASLSIRKEMLGLRVLAKFRTLEEYIAMASTFEKISKVVPADNTALACVVTLIPVGDDREETSVSYLSGYYDTASMNDDRYEIETYFRDGEWNAFETNMNPDIDEEENQKALLPFLRKLKTRFPDTVDEAGNRVAKKNIWAFTGYLLEDLLPGGRKHTDDTDEMLSYVDILVDGPFILAQKNLCLKFRGSENQRLIDMNEYRKSGKVVTILES